LRAKIINEKDIPKKCLKILGLTHGERINTMVHDMIKESLDRPVIKMSPKIWSAMDHLRNFLFKKVYLDSIAKTEEKKTKKLLKDLFYYYLDHPKKLPGYKKGVALKRQVCDFIAGMTDRYAIAKYNELFIPGPWMG